MLCSGCFSTHSSCKYSELISKINAEITSIFLKDETTLVYGSNDGGRTVKDESEPFREMMEQVGQFLNLKKHQIGNSGKYLFLAADVGKLTKVTDVRC